jgi:hypothetical protein
VGHADVRAAHRRQPALHGHDDAAADPADQGIDRRSDRHTDPRLDNENQGNLAPAFIQQIVKKYEGTRLGRQELEAEVLDDVPGALWTRALIEAARPRLGFVMPDLVRVVARKGRTGR